MKDDRTVLEVYREVLPVKLTPKEEAQRAKRLAQVNGELEDLERQTRELLTAARQRRRELEKERRELARCVLDSAEPREVEVLVVADYQRGVAEHLRGDTHERLEDKTRPLCGDERQRRLFNDGPPVPPVHLPRHPGKQRGEMP
jgi:hypothetical protein